MFTDEITAEVPQLALPADLLAAVSHRKPAAVDFHVDGWKPSFLDRLARLFGLD